MCGVGFVVAFAGLVLGRHGILVQISQNPLRKMARSTILSLMSSKHPRINDQIRSASVRLIDEEGEPLGVVLIERAKEMAREQEVDLVGHPNAQPRFAN